MDGPKMKDIEDEFDVDFVEKLGEDICKKALLHSSFRRS